MLLATGSAPRDPVAVEPKRDGTRSIVTVHGGRVVIHSRNGHDVTDCYPELGAIRLALAGRSAVLDTEIVAFDPTCRCEFQRMQTTHERPPPVYGHCGGHSGRSGRVRSNPCRAARSPNGEPPGLCMCRRTDSQPCSEPGDGAIGRNPASFMNATARAGVPRTRRTLTSDAVLAAAPRRPERAALLRC
jgi:hypothetical protein